jgi:hypothetical protein
MKVFPHSTSSNNKEVIDPVQKKALPTLLSESGHNQSQPKAKAGYRKGDKLRRRDMDHLRNGEAREIPPPRWHIPV